jgi:DNA-binding CsgD family transcriptional regulator
MRIMLVRGDLASATRFGNEAAAIFGDLDNHAPRRWAVAGLVLAAAQTGDVERAAAGRAQLDLLGPSGVTFLESDVERARAWADAAEGRLDEARQSLIATAERKQKKSAKRTATALLRDLRVRCPDAATPPLLDVPISSLSPRERDVVRLAAAGLTSREIGERLHLSVRTIDNLLQRSYVKLGVSGRRELPGAVDNHGG